VHQIESNALALAMRNRQRGAVLTAARHVHECAVANANVSLKRMLMLAALVSAI
jgi:hypothetical protein